MVSQCVAKPFKSLFRGLNPAWLVQGTWTMDILSLLSNCSHGDMTKLHLFETTKWSPKTLAELMENLYPRDLSQLKKIPHQKNSHENNLARKSYKIKYRAPTHFLITRWQAGTGSAPTAIVWMKIWRIERKCVGPRYCKWHFLYISIKLASLSEKMQFV